MEPNLLGSPLEALQTAYRDLTAKIAANSLSLDEALLELQAKEVVDATGNTWRIDPVTQSFIRRAPGADSPWKQADPSGFAMQAPADAGSGGPMGPPVQYGPGGPIPDLPQEGTNRRKPRWPIYAVGGAAAVVVAVVAAVAVMSQGTQSSPDSAASRTTIPKQQSSNPRATPSTSNNPSTPPSPGTSSSPKTPTTGGPTGGQGKGSPVPPEPVYDGVVSEFTSGDLSRISHVTESSQYSPTAQRYYAATFGGWADFGLTIRAEPPVADSSGRYASQVWNLISRGDVIASANVTWHRASDSTPWLLTKWPEFQPR